MVAGGEGLRLTVMSMLRMEKARMRAASKLLKDPLLAVAPGLADRDLVEMDVELVSFQQARSLEYLGATELLARVELIKAQSNKQFRAGDASAACGGYERGRRILQLVPSTLAEEEATSLKALQLALLLNSAMCAMRAQKHVDALAHSDTALALAPGTPKAHFRRAQALEALGRLVEAEAALEAVLQLQPNNKEAHEKLRMLRGKTRETALSELGFAVDVSATELLARVEALKAQSNKQFGAGDAAAACGGYERGRRILQLVPSTLAEEEATSLKALQLALLLNSAMCAMRAQKHVDALAHSDTALALAPGTPKAHFRRAQALEALGRLVEAEAALEAVLQLQPNNKEAHEKLRMLRLV